MKQTFLERLPIAPEAAIDDLEKLLRQKVQLKTGFADDFVLSRTLQSYLRSVTLNDDLSLDANAFSTALVKLNCGNDRFTMSGLFHRYDRNASGKILIKDFADSLFGLKPLGAAALDCRDILKSIRTQLIARGGLTYRFLLRELAAAEAQSGPMDPAALRALFKSFGVSLPNDSYQKIFNYFDSNKNGKVSASELSVGLRPQNSEPRLALARLTFMRLDRSPDGTIRFENLIASYRPDRHPDVRSGRRAESEVLDEFLKSWPQTKATDVVTERDFIDYYRDLSVVIDSDSQFELLIRSTWYIQTNVTNAASVEVLVTHLDGTSTIEMLDADLGVDTSSPTALTSTLRKQGITDVLRADTSFFK